MTRRIGVVLALALWSTAALAADGENTGYLVGPSDVLRTLGALLGGVEATARVPLAVPPESDLLQEIRRCSAGLDIRALAATYAPGVGWKGLLRLRGRSGVA